MKAPALQLVSHALCPYAQRVAIVLAEKGIPFTRRDIDLADKPAWFTAMSPLGKVPLLLVDGEVLFESAVICEYLDETAAPRLHPEAPLARARQRAWVEFASASLAAIAALYNAPDQAALLARCRDLGARFEQLEAQLGEGPYFGGTAFTMVDAAFAPVLRYFDVVDQVADFGLFGAKPKLRRWRAALAARPSVAQAAPANYAALLLDFLRRRPSRLGALAA
jgi:glutathione S-transferase